MLTFIWTGLAVFGSFVTSIFLWRAFRCLHDWEPIVERELPAVADLIDKDEVNRWADAVLTYNAGRKKFFAIIKCRKCGHVKVFETLSGSDRRL